MRALTIALASVLALAFGTTTLAIVLEKAQDDVPEYPEGMGAFGTDFDDERLSIHAMNTNAPDASDASVDASLPGGATNGDIPSENDEGAFLETSGSVEGLPSNAPLGNSKDSGLVTDAPSDAAPIVATTASDTPDAVAADGIVENVQGVGLNTNDTLVAESVGPVNAPGEVSSDSADSPAPASSNSVDGPAAESSDFVGAPTAASGDSVDVKGPASNNTTVLSPNEGAPLVDWANDPESNNTTALSPNEGAPLVDWAKDPESNNTTALSPNEGAPLVNSTGFKGDSEPTKRRLEATEAADRSGEGSLVAETVVSGAVGDVEKERTGKNGGHRRPGKALRAGKAPRYGMRGGNNPRKETKGYKKQTKRGLRTFHHGKKGAREGRHPSKNGRRYMYGGRKQSNGGRKLGNRRHSIESSGARGRGYNRKPAIKPKGKNPIHRGRHTMYG
jgi:hypothetical protein